MIDYGKKIVSESYYEGSVVKAKVELESEHFTDRDHLLKDMIDALMVITAGKTRDLNLRIQVDKQGRYKLTQRYVAQ